MPEKDRAELASRDVVSRAILVHNRGRSEHLADSIVITPSHNPPEDGGFKYNPPDGGPADTQVTKAIEERANTLLREGNRGVVRMPFEAAMRETVVGVSLFSPFPFHSVYSVEDHKKHLDWAVAINPKALLSVKVSTPNDVEMVSVGSYYAGAHIGHLDGGYGGTGAAPEIAKKNIAMPIEYAIPKVHRFLINEGIRDQVTLIASGGLRTAMDVAKAIALGADGAVIGTADLVALGCVRCANCESGRGCPRGIATTDPELQAITDSGWGASRIYNMYSSWCLQWCELLHRLGMTDISELRGRFDLLSHGDNPAREVGK